MMLDSIDKETLPETLHVQVDGGKENANKYVLAVLSYLLAVRFGGVRKIIITRLPVGHTHEDIDGIFGIISKYIVKLHLITPQAYKRAIYDALRRKGSLQYLVVDIWVIPNYCLFFLDCIDKNFGRCFTGNNTKLQFTLEKVEPDIERYPNPNPNPNLTITLTDIERYPVGVKVTCRKYTSDVYPELRVDEQSPMGIKVVGVESVTFPLENAAPLNILLSYPSLDRKLQPDEFVEDSLGMLNTYAEKIAALYPSDIRIQSEILEFCQEAPDTDDVHGWVETEPSRFYIPFAEFFVGDRRLTEGQVSPIEFPDMRKKQNKHLFGISNYDVVKDTDTVSRSLVRVVEGKRVYAAMPTVPGQRKPSMKDCERDSVHFKALNRIEVRKLQDKIQKYDGSQFLNLEENADQQIFGIYKHDDLGLLTRGRTKLYYGIRHVEDELDPKNVVIEYVLKL